MAEQARQLNGEQGGRGPRRAEAPLQVVGTVSERMRERVRVSEIGRAQAAADPRGTVWSQYGLLDQLTAPPHPMTWSLLRRMMSGRGGYGRLFRELGFEPDAALDEPGVLDLICGRPYFNLSRVARMYFADFPFTHPIELIKSDPQRAAHPSPQLDLRAASPWLWRRLPRTYWRMMGVRRRLERMRRTLAEPLVSGIVPLFIAEVRRAHDEDVARMDTGMLLVRLRAWVRRVVDEFSVEVLKTSAVATYATHLLEKRYGVPEAARLLSDVSPRAEADVDALLDRAAWTPWPFESLLEAVGHRGPDEMELATPRWGEVPQQLYEELERRRTLMPPRRVRIPEAADEEIRLARTWLALRETAPHWLMYGWQELRRILLALDRRLRLDGGVFWLTLEELGPAAEGRVRRDLLDDRIERHRLMEGLRCPRVLFSDDLDAIGRD